MSDAREQTEQEPKASYTRLTIEVEWWPGETDHPKDWFAYQAQKQMGDLVGYVSQISHEEREACPWCNSPQKGRTESDVTTFECGSMIGCATERKCGDA